MEKRISVGKRLADDMKRRGIDALFGSEPEDQSTSTPAKAKKFEKGTFYFDPEDLEQLERVWLHLMGRGLRCNKSEIVSILLRTGLTDHEKDPSNSVLSRQLTGKRRRS